MSGQKHIGRRENAVDVLSNRDLENDEVAERGKFHVRTALADIQNIVDGRMADFASLAKRLQESGSNILKDKQVMVRLPPEFAWDFRIRLNALSPIASVQRIQVILQEMNILLDAALIHMRMPRSPHSLQNVKQEYLLPEKKVKIGKACVDIRWMTRRDMPEVLTIEQLSCDYPWLEDDFIQALRLRNCIGMVSECQDVIIGFMIYELHKSYLEVINMGVAPHCRGLGVGSQMIQKLVGKLSSHRRTQIQFQLRETDLDGQIFLRSQNFRATETLPKHFEDGEDAYVMIYSIPGEISSREDSDNA